MKKGLKIFKNIVSWIGILTIFLFASMAIYHHIKLSKEEKSIKVTGTLVEVDGYCMNILLTGKEKKSGEPTIVLLSSSGVTAPVYEYKILYSKLLDKQRIAVIEKFGYGYSDVSGLSRDVKTMVEEDRKALKNTDENGPYVLMPHSMSALEAIYWAKHYPKEVKAIIGLDMAVPDSYNENNNNTKIIFMRTMTFFGMQRIPAFFYINDTGLSEDEIEQNRYLVYKNSLNTDVYAECEKVYENAKQVKKLGAPNVPILMFTTNLGNSAGWKNWMKAQTDFAQQSDKYIQIKLDCGHNLHYYKSDYIAHKINEFMAKIE